MEILLIIIIYVMSHLTTYLLTPYGRTQTDYDNIDIVIMSSLPYINTALFIIILWRIIFERNNDIFSNKYNNFNRAKKYLKDNFKIKERL